MLSRGNVAAVVRCTRVSILGSTQLALQWLPHRVLEHGVWEGASRPYADGINEQHSTPSQDR